MPKSKFLWQGKVINHAQIGGIELSTIENGPGRGTRIAWVNTGSGLRYKVVIDRACDIVDTFFNQYSLCWLSHAGIISARPDANKGIEWLYTFAGGLVTTCGLTQAGAADEEFGLHGRISNALAELVSIIQPDIHACKLDMSITAVVKQSKVFGENLELKRTISSRLNEPVIKIYDVVTNRGNSPAPLMMLYHCNFGWPLVDAGADILYKGKCISRGGDKDNELFSGKHNFHKVPPPLKSHSGSGEACGFIDIAPDKKGICTAGIHNRKIGLAAVIKFSKKQLPWLANWQHWGQGEYVCGLEPGTNPPIGQKKAKETGELIYLKPGVSKIFELEISVIQRG